MKVYSLFAFTIFIGLFLLLSGSVIASTLEDQFLEPPHDALPRGYWLWPHGNFDYSSIKQELEAFKEKGLGGVDIFDIGVRDRNDVIPPGPGFMSPEQVDGIAYALQEAKKLDLKLGLIVSSSWNAGGTWTQPEEALMNLVAWSESVQGPTQYSKELPFPDVPDKFSKPYGDYTLSVPKDEHGIPEYYKNIAIVMFPTSPDEVLEIDDIRILSDQFNKDGVLTVNVPSGEWTIMRVVCTNFGQMLWVPSDNSRGLIMDHFSKEATRNHFQTIIDRLEDRVGELANTALERLYLASYESDAEVIWTPKFQEEFLERNGYDITPYIPALFGQVIGGEEHTERFLYDFRKTVSDVFVENLYLEARSICHENGLLLCSESGGPGPPLHNVPTEDLKALGAVDVMRGEFWNRETRWRDEDGLDVIQVVKGIANAAHIYGHKIVEMESFTSMINWQEGPSTLKPLADRAFCEGMNRVVYHTMSHNLPEAGKPGWTYQAGTHINTNLTWWPMSDQFHSYLARCSALLQYGLFAADACFYYGHEIPNFCKTKHIRPTLGPGYDYDDINTEILLTATVEDGKISLPSGMQYNVLVLPEDERMDVAIIEKIQSLLKDGATIVGPKPSTIYGLKGYPQDETKLQKIADSIWGTGASKQIDRKVGKGRILTDTSVRDVLLEKGIMPDLQIIGTSYTDIDFIHRYKNNEDIYFVRNRKDESISFDAIFRVHDRIPEQWDPVSGITESLAIFSSTEDGTRIPMILQPHESVFIVFRQTTSGKNWIKALAFEGKQVFPIQEGSARETEYQFAGYYEKDSVGFYSKKAGKYNLTFDSGEKTSITIDEARHNPITGSWNVGFPFGWDVEPVQTFDSLFSWTDSEDPGLQAFSGIATYRKTFIVPNDFLQSSAKIVLDLGQVREVARVYLNGEKIGISSFAPHELDVSHAIRSGENHLVVEVANTWLNRLIADHTLPEEERLTHTNVSRNWKSFEPLPSGLMGPVKVTAKEYRSIDIP